MVEQAREILRSMKEEEIVILRLHCHATIVKDGEDKYKIYEIGRDGKTRPLDVMNKSELRRLIESFTEFAAVGRVFVDEVVVADFVLRVGIVKNRDGTFSVYEIEREGEEIKELFDAREDELVRFMGSFTVIEVEGRG